MSAYAIAILNEVEIGPAIVEYLERIDATLEAFGGRFIIHGAQPVMREGESPGTPVVIEFPDLDRAAAWYNSAEYQAIVGLRTGHSRGIAFLVDGVGADHVATDVLGRTPTGTAKDATPC
jgi:uncharacterized protein (DUF1330 family)